MDDPDSSVTDDILDGTGKTNGDRDTADDGLLDSGDQTPADNGTTAPVPGDDTATDNHTSNQDGTMSGTDSDTLGAIAPGSAPATTRCWKTPESTTPTET